MNKTSRAYHQEKLVLIFLIVLVALVHSCGKDTAPDSPDNQPIPSLPEISAIYGWSATGRLHEFKFN